MLFAGPERDDKQNQFAKERVPSTDRVVFPFPNEEFVVWLVYWGRFLCIKVTTATILQGVSHVGDLSLSSRGPLGAQTIYLGYPE